MNIARPVSRIRFFERLEPRRLLSAPASFNPSGLGGGGWFGPTSINPYNHNEVWMPTDMGELFHSTDGGATWTYPPLAQISESYCSSVQFTGNPNVMWAIDAAAGYPSESTDGGNTWSDASSGSNLLGRANFLYTDPNLTSDFIVCSTTNGSGANNYVYLSKDGGATWGSPVYVGNPGTDSSGTALELVVSGLFKEGNNVWIPTSQGILHSSNNGGSFSMLTVPWNPGSEACTSMAASRVGDTIRFVATTVDPAALYVHNTFEWSSSAKGVYLSDFTVSTNTQGAWTNITNRLPANKFEGFAAMAQGNIGTIYLGGEDSNDYGVPSVLKSSDGGLSWSETFQYVNNANIATNQYGYWGGDYDYSWCSYAMSLQVCSNDVNRVTISDMGTAWMTTDGGAGGTNTAASNADWRDITVAPQYLHNPGTVAPQGTTPYGGSADNTACYNLIFQSPTNIFAAMTDQTGMYSTDGGASWYYPTYNSGAKFSNFFGVTEDYRTGVLFAAAGKQNDLFKNWRLTNGNRDGRGGGLDYSTDGGKTWSLLRQWSNPGGTFNPLTEVVIDPNLPGRAYALVANSTNGGIWRTENLYLADGMTVNANATWTQLPVPSRYLSAFIYGFGSQAYSAGAYAAHDPNDLKVLNDGTLVAVFDETYAPTGPYMWPSSGIWVSTDDGNTWTDRSDLNLAESNMMFFSQKICIDPQDPTQNTWYVATDYNWPDYRNDNYGVFKTTDRGAHWTQIFTGDVNDTGLGCDNVTVNPDTGEMYLSTTTDGVYYSATRSNFTKLNQVPYPDVDSVVIDPYRTSQVWVCTHGNGMRKGDTATDSPSDLAVAGNSGHQFALVWTAVGGATGYQVQYTNDSVNWTGAVTWTTYSPLPAGSTSTNIDGLAGNSAYSFRVVPLNGSTPIGYSNIVTGAVPGAPTGLTVAVCGPSQIECQWSDNHRFNSGYHLQYSSDGVSWQNLATIASPTATVYSAAGLQPDTQYSFRLTAFSATSQSAPSNVAVARTLKASGLIAYEGFNYAPDANNSNEILGQTGGFGWSGGWRCDYTDGSRDAIAGSLVGTNSTVGANLLTTGNMFEANNYGEIYRDLAAPTSNASGTTLWLSFLVKTYNAQPISYIQLVDATGAGNNVSVGFPRSNNYSIAVDGTNSWNTGTQPAAGETHFLVMEISYNATADNIQMWIDPDPAAASPGTPAINGNAGIALPAFNQINVVAGWWGGVENDWDEIRLGTSYAAVAPGKVPASPTGLTATAGAGQIDLAWTDNASNETGYAVQRSTDQVNWTPTGGLLAPNATSFIDSSAALGTTYYYRIDATGFSGNSIYSNSASAWLDPAPVATVSLNWHAPLTNDVLTATATALDPDGKPVTLTYVWKVNGVTKQTDSTTSLTDTFNLGVPGNGDTGDTITVEVTPNDGAANGPVVSDSATVASAATWSGGGGADNTWNNPANWGGRPLQANDPLLFSGGNGSISSNNVSAGTQFNGITFQTGAGPFVLGGNGVGLGGDITNNSASTETIGLPLTLVGGSRTLNAAAGPLMITADIGQSGGSYGIFKTGAGTVTLSGTNSYSGDTIVSSGKLIVTTLNALPGIGTLTVGAGAAFDPAANAATWTSSGSSVWNNAANWTNSYAQSKVPGIAPRPDNTDTAVFNGAGSIIAIDLTGVNPSLKALNFSTANYMFSGGSLTLKSDSGTATVIVTNGTQTISSPLTLVSSADMVVTHSADRLTISGQVGGSASLLKDGAGTLALSGNNNYAGGTVVRAGTLIVATSTALPSGSSLAVGAGGTFTYDSPPAGAPLASTGRTAKIPAAAATPSAAANVRPISPATSSGALALRPNVAPSIVATASPSFFPEHVLASAAQAGSAGVAAKVRVAQKASAAAKAKDVVFSRILDHSTACAAAWLWSVLAAQNQENKSGPQPNVAAVDKLLAMMAQ